MTYRVFELPGPPPTINIQQGGQTFAQSPGIREVEGLNEKDLAAAKRVLGKRATTPGKKYLIVKSEAITEVTTKLVVE